MKKGGKLGKLQFEQIKNPGSFGVVGKFPRKFSETRKTVELTKCNLFDRKKISKFWEVFWLTNVR